MDVQAAAVGFDRLDGWSSLMRTANGREAGQHVGREYCVRTDAVGRMMVCEGCVLRLLSDVGVVCRFTFAAHQYDALATVALPAGRAHQVAAWCIESSAASAGMRGKVVCTGVRLPGCIWG